MYVQVNTLIEQTKSCLVPKNFENEFFKKVVKRHQISTCEKCEQCVHFYGQFFENELKYDDNKVQIKTCKDLGCHQFFEDFQQNPFHKEMVKMKKIVKEHCADGSCQYCQMNNDQYCREFSYKDNEFLSARLARKGDIIIVSNYDLIEAEIRRNHLNGEIHLKNTYTKRLYSDVGAYKDLCFESSCFKNRSSNLFYPHFCEYHQGKRIDIANAFGQFNIGDEPNLFFEFKLEKILYFEENINPGSFPITYFDDFPTAPKWWPINSISYNLESKQDLELVRILIKLAYQNRGLGERLIGFDRMKCLSLFEKDLKKKSICSLPTNSIRLN